MKIKRIIWIITLLLTSYLGVNMISIYFYSKQYSENKSDVGIILGAGTKDGKISPVFRERINHGIYLYQKGLIEKIIFTGGKGKNQKMSDSELAKNYALQHGVLERDIIIESKSKYTYENLNEAKKIMTNFKLKSALIISDPLHMKRSMLLAKRIKIKCESSPTQTSMYKSLETKFKLLISETIFYSMRKVTFWE